jgi:hypothetical protein
LRRFSRSFETPRVQQGSLNLERELAHGVTGTLSYLYVHGVDMIRARDVNLPPPTFYTIYDPTGTNFQNAFYNVESFATWPTTQSISCPFPACITLSIARYRNWAQSTSLRARPRALRGMTVSRRKRMRAGMYFRQA